MERAQLGPTGELLGKRNPAGLLNSPQAEAPLEPTAEPMERTPKSLLMQQAGGQASGRAEAQAPAHADVQPDSPLPCSPPSASTTSAHKTPSSTSNGAGYLSPIVHPIVPTLITLVGQIRQELETSPARLLQLNPSRREAVALHLDRLANIPHGPSQSSGASDAAGGLRRWIVGPRSSAQNQALRTYFEEIAWTVVGQAIVLKSWSDRGVRPWKQGDLGRLNWELSSALRPHLPMDREGWQITRPNLYSWYNPSPLLQSEIWNALEGWNLAESGPALLASLVNLGRHALPGASEFSGYDPRFYSSVWQSISSFGAKIDPEHVARDPLRRRRLAFSPTLRSGAILRSGPNTLDWIGLESHPFQLLFGELVQLWWGPAAPPLWAQGTGLEVHSRDQLALALGSPKPSLMSRIAEMEACDIAFVLEERSVRANQRTYDALAFREQLDSLPYFKKLRSSGTSLGALQACVSLTKLRPGGLLWWFREEPLTQQDGAETLGFLLDNGKLLYEWDLSGLEHSLPTPTPLFAKYVYLFAREISMQERITHRPTRVDVSGQLRSHIELPQLLQDALRRSASQKSPWQIHSHESPLTQREWSERWPEKAAPETVRALERLRSDSQSLASLCTIRAAKAQAPEKDQPALWVDLTESKAHGKIEYRVTATPAGGAQPGSGFYVFLPNPSWRAPLAAYLESAAVSVWLEHHTERKNERWILTEQVLKFVPVPKRLIRTMSEAEPPLPAAWSDWTAQPSAGPKDLQRLAALGGDANARDLKTALFVRTARLIEKQKQAQLRVLEMVGEQGKIRWGKLLAILPRSECIPVTLHPTVKMTGTIPPHLPISRMDRVRTPSPGVLFATEAGFNLHLGSENPRILEMIEDQLAPDGKSLGHPTWSELVQYLRLPKQIDLAESTASDVLRAHGEHCARVRDLSSFLCACTDF